MPYATFCPPPTQEAQAEHNPHTTTGPQISPTEWSSAIRAIHCLEEALRQLIHLEEVAPIAHEILLARDTLNPFAVIRVRRRP